MHSQVTRQQIEQYLPLVVSVARKVASTLPVSVDKDDLRQAGCIGLLEAIKSFDPERGIRFEPFALQRIRGAMLDELRSIDPLTRSERQAVKAHSAFPFDSLHRTGRWPTTAERAAHLGMTYQEYRAAEAEFLHFGFADLDSRTDETLPGSGWEPEQMAMEREHLRLIDKALSALSKRDKGIVLACLIDGEQRQDVAKREGVTPTRISQILNAAVRSIAAQLRGAYEH